MPRRTKIICTLGPSTSSEEAVMSLIEAGMDIARLNFSHEAKDKHLERIKTVRACGMKSGRDVKILQDLPGPKIRVGNLSNPMELVMGSHVVLSENKERRENYIPIAYALYDVVEVGSEIYLADGAMKLKVTNIDKEGIGCTVENGGTLKSRKGINIPDSASKIEAITKEDIDFMKFGVENGVDYIALSFVRTGDDVRQAKRIIKESGHSTPVIAKIECKDGVRNYKDIIDAADGVMVARGDLGVEIGLENVPRVQKMVLWEAKRAGKFSITATQMLASMVDNAAPTRAEVSDAANAIVDGSGALMLSEETAVGKHYVNAVRVLDRVAAIAEMDFTTMFTGEIGKMEEKISIR
ncbi:MAG: pyruvate kinase [Candidatus Marsarchaeota archaeon]|nr:pyruvate kinase [Candidatus Marsarchaeota archaeon]